MVRIESRRGEITTYIFRFSHLFLVQSTLLDQSRSFWWQIDFRLDISRCWVALWPVELSGRGSGRVCLGAWGFSYGLRGPSPRLLLPSGRFGLSPGAWGAPNKGNADGAVGIFGNSGRVWATALRPVPPKKRPCAILARKVGRSTNTPVYIVRSVPIILVTNLFRTGPLQVLGSTLAGRVVGTRFGKSVLGSWGFPTASGAFPQAITPFGEVGLITRRLRYPNKGNADGALDIFGKYRARVGYGPAPRPTEKRPSAILARKVGHAINTGGSHFIFWLAQKSLLF